MEAAACAQVLAQERLRLGVQNAHVQLVPAGLHLLPDPARRGAVVGGGDLDAAVEVDRALAEAVVAEGLQRRLAQRGLLLGKHRRHLTLGRAVDARVCPALLPVVEVRLRLFQALEAQPLERRPLGVADAGLDLALAIRVPDATRQGDRPVVPEQLAVERIELGVVHVGRDDAFAEVVEDHDAGRATEPSEGTLVKLRPDPSRRTPHEQPHRLARVPERQHEQPGASVLAAVGVAHHRPLAVVDLTLLPRCRGDHAARLYGRAPTQLHDEAPDARVARPEAVAVDQLLPDRHRVALLRQRLDHNLAVGLARAGARRPPGRRGRERRARVGGHLPGNGWL